MARPQDLYIPKIQYFTLKKVLSNDFRTRYKALRNISSNFIRRNDVKTAIFEKCNSKCSMCGSTNNLQIDHVVSVYNYALNKLPYYTLNSYENLVLLCRKCNAAKSPV